MQVLSASRVILRMRFWENISLDFTLKRISMLASRALLLRLLSARDASKLRDGANGRTDRFFGRASSSIQFATTRVIWSALQKSLVISARNGRLRSSFGSHRR